MSKHRTTLNNTTKREPTEDQRLKHLNQEHRRRVADELFKLDSSYASECDRYLNCGKKAVAVLTCPNSINHASRIVCEHCDNRGCSECAARLSQAMIDRWLSPLEAVIQANPHPGYKVRHMVLTSDIDAMQPDAKERYLEVRSKIEPTLQDCIMPRRAGETARAYRERWRAMKKKIGWLENDEFGEHGNKAHFHLTYYGPFIPQPVLSRAWQAQTGYSVVFITLRKDDTLRDTLREAMKYVTKFVADGAVIEPAILARIIHIVHGRRRVRGHGIFYNMPQVTQDDQPDQPCPECQAALEAMELGQWLQKVNDAITAAKHDPDLADLTADVFGVLASAATNANPNNMFTAARQWRELFGDNPPAYAEFLSQEAQPTCTTNLKFREGNKSARFGDRSSDPPQNRGPSGTKNRRIRVDATEYMWQKAEEKQSRRAEL